MTNKSTINAYIKIIFSLLLSGAISFIISELQIFNTIFSNNLLSIALITSGIILTIYISTKKNSFNETNSGILLIIFSIASAVIFSIIFMMYQLENPYIIYFIIAFSFFVTSIFEYNSRKKKSLNNSVIFIITGTTTTILFIFTVERLKLFWTMSFCTVGIFAYIIQTDAKIFNKDYRNMPSKRALTMYSGLVTFFYLPFKLLKRRQKYLIK